LLFQDKALHEDEREKWDTKLNEENWGRQCAEKQLEEVMRLVATLEKGDEPPYPRRRRQKG
jgi:hypothetical protein